VHNATADYRGRSVDAAMGLTRPEALVVDTCSGDIAERLGHEELVSRTRPGS
jgi:acetate kinase